MTKFAGKVGFASPAPNKKVCKSRVGIALLATLSLAASLMIAGTAVSISVARAQAFGTAHHSNGAPLALAVFPGLILAGMIPAGMSGLPALAARAHRSPPR